MKKSELINLLQELTGLNDFELKLKPYSKLYYGNYRPIERLITIYFLDKDKTYFPDEKIVETALHEMSHHIQWHHTPGWVRRRGIMHDEGFVKIYNELLEKYHGNSHTPFAMKKQRKNTKSNKTVKLRPAASAKNKKVEGLF